MDVKCVCVFVAMFCRFLVNFFLNVEASLVCIYSDFLKWLFYSNLHLLDDSWFMLSALPNLFLMRWANSRGFDIKLPPSPVIPSRTLPPTFLQIIFKCGIRNHDGRSYFQIRSNFAINMHKIEHASKTKHTKNRTVQPQTNIKQMMRN